MAANSKLSHLNSKGELHMVDVGAKAKSDRFARAESSLKMNPDALRALQEEGAQKGDVLAAARVAGILAAKKTAELIPLCHPLPLTHVTIDFFIEEAGLRIEARAETRGRTGVEMEALCAASLAALTVYDMLKSIDKGLVIEATRLLEKSGGKSGHWVRA